VSRPELLLAIYAVLICLFLAVRRPWTRGFWRGIAGVGVALVVSALAVGSHRLAAAPMITIDHVFVRTAP